MYNLQLGMNVRRSISLSFPATAKAQKEEVLRLTRQLADMKAAVNQLKERQISVIGMEG